MAFRNLIDGVRNFFGPNNTFFNGPRAREDEDNGYAAAQPQQQPAYEDYYAPQQQPAQATYAAPQGYGAYPQQQGYTAAPQQQGYTAAPQAEDAHAHRTHRTQAAAAAENVVPFPGNPAQGAAEPAAAAQPQQSAVSFTVVNIRAFSDCCSAINALRNGSCIAAVMDAVADQGEVRRCIDMLNGASFSLGCSFTRLSRRVPVYLLVPASIPVYTDQRTATMNSQSRAPRPAQSAYRAPYAAPEAYGAPAYGAAAAQASPFAPPQVAAYPPQQPYAAPQGYVPQPVQGYAPRPQQTYAPQPPSQGYAPDASMTDYAEASL